MRKQVFTLVVLFLTLFVPAASAQTAATVTGTVLDPSGLVVPGVTVTARSGATGLVRTGVTGPEGRFVIAQLPPGVYEIRAEIAGPQGPGGRGSGTIEITNRVVGREQVTVPAGTYDALKVESTMAIKMSVRVGQMTVPANRNVRNTNWFAENVGMVKSISAPGDFAGATTELVSLKR